MTAPTAKPIAKYRAGPVHVALWENTMKRDDRETLMHKVSIERRYRGSDGAWRSTTSFTRNELPMIRFCLEQAYAEIIRRENERSSSSAPSGRDERANAADQPSRDDGHFDRPA